MATLSLSAETTLKKLARESWFSGRPLHVSFVCTGNICRSPTGEGVLKALVRRRGLSSFVTISSSGTSGHEGWSPDPRTLRTAAVHGFDLSAQKGRRVTTHDFQEVDLMLALDSGHYEYLDARRLKLGRGCRAAVHYVTTFAAAHRAGDLDIIDPYYEDTECFETVFRIIEEACVNITAVVASLVDDARGGRPLDESLHPSDLFAER